MAVTEELVQSRDLALCDPELQRVYPLLAADFTKETGHVLIPTCTWRSVAEQKRLYLLGRRGVPGERIVTQLDGTVKKSRHNLTPSRAIDIAIDLDPGIGKFITWHKEYYAPLGPLCKKHGLVWGGEWRMDDYCHIELT